MTNAASLLESFTGTVRLFPLPHLVFFPRTVQPLHIFEPRYRQLTADALASDRLIAMVLPLPGWENDYAGRPALHAIGCLGHIDAEQRLEDGRYNLLLRGLSRIHVQDEIPHDKLYRLASAELLSEEPITSNSAQQAWRTALTARCAVWFAGQPELLARLNELLHGPCDPGALGDLLAFLLPLHDEAKQQLLAECDDEARLLHLVRMMEGASAK